MEEERATSDITENEVIDTTAEDGEGKNNQLETINESQMSLSTVIDKWITFRGSQEINGNAIVDRSTINPTLEDRKFVPPTGPLTTLEQFRRASVRSQDSFCYVSILLHPENLLARRREVTEHRIFVNAGL